MDMLALLADVVSVPVIVSQKKVNTNLPAISYITLTAYLPV